ncbi:hypothetical protein SCUP515_06696 [Seiridium cupressi]
MFANNTTIPAPLIPGFPPSAGDSDNGNQFSLANLFGMFLTITISGPIGRAVFFFWRINPLACAAEALLVLYALCEVAWVAVTGSSHQNADPVTHSIGERFDAGIAALLLVRKHSRLPPHWALARANEGTAPRESSVADGQGSIAPGTSEASTRGSTNGRVIENGSVADLNDEPRSFNGTQGRGVGDATPQSQGTPILRDVEDNEPSTDGETTALLGRRQLRSALRSNILANGELLVDVTTLVATGFVILKLLLLPSRWPFAWLLGRGRPGRYRIAREDIRATRFKTSKFADEGFNLDTFTTRIAVHQLHSMHMSLMWASISLDCFGCISRRRRRNCSECPPCAVQGLFKPNWKEGVLRMILISGAGVLGGICGYVSSYLWTELVNICLLDPSKIWACWLLLVFYGLFVVLWFGLLVQNSLELSQSLLVITLFWNLTTTILIFVGAMIQYSPEDTYKPDWLDWFGRRFKTFDVSELSFY